MHSAFTTPRDYIPGRACFHQQTGQCRGACVGAEPPQEYRERVDLACAQLGQRITGTFIFADKGPRAGERTLFYIRRGLVVGYGVFPEESAVTPDHLADQWIPLPNTPEVRSLIRQSLTKQRLRIIWKEEE